jgi:hypothetical protein
MIKKRYLTKYILDDLNEKMVFVGGPRQVGKTTLASELVSNNFSQFDYFNWDNRQDRMRMLKSEWSGNASLIIFDEIHKYNKWKTFIKGEYDKLKKKYKFILTGSARLDIYRKGGDSMQGRYFYYCLHPFTLAELINESKRPDLFKEIVFPSKFMKNEWLMLDKFGGFPEPIIKQSSRMLRRWHQDKHDRVFRDDIRDVENIRDISSVQLLGNLLPERVASPLSINSIREDLEVSHKAVSRWLNILESFYYCFRIYPYTGKNYRSLKKNPKLYLWDWSEIRDEPSRFENCVACHLLKYVHFLHDYEGYDAKLHYLRNAEKKEVDFLVVVDDKPWFAVEVKLNDTNISPNLHFYQKKINIPFLYQVLKTSGIDRYINGIRLISADRFFLAFL